jgi:hypothetical protein
MSMGQDNKSPHKPTHLSTYINDISDHEWTFSMQEKTWFDTYHVTISKNGWIWNELYFQW